MTINWARYKDDIVALHAEGRNLPEIRRIIELNRDGFNPCESSWRSRLKEWGCVRYQPVAPRPSLSRPQSTTHAASIVVADIPPRSERPPNVSSESETILPLTCARPLASDSFSNFKHPGLNIDNFDESFPLHSALQLGNEVLIDEILSGGTNTNLQTLDGFTPLHIAVRAGVAPSCIEKLISFGADASITDGHGNLPLHWAISWNWTVADKLFGSTFDAGATRNQSGITPLESAFISFRLGKCALEHLDSIRSETGEKYYLYGDVCLRGHLLGSLCRNHDTATRGGRTVWWELMISSSAKTQPLEMLGKMEGFAVNEKGLTAFPNSEVLLFESLLRDLPSLASSHKRKIQLLDLGDALVDKELEVYLRRCSSQDLFDNMLNLLIEGGCSGFWRDYPERIIWWMNDLVTSSCRKHRCVCDELHVAQAACRFSGKSLLMKAIETFPLPKHAEGLHIASVFVKYGADAFQKERNGQVPLLVAAESGQERLVESMLERDLQFKSSQRRVNGGAIGQQDDRFYWPEWEESKATDDWQSAMALLEPARLDLFVSAPVYAVLSKAAMSVTLGRIGKELSSSRWFAMAERQAKRAQLIGALDHCRKYQVRSDDWSYEKLVYLL